MAYAFSPEQQEQVGKSVESIASVFFDRFNKKQFEDFKQNEYAEYIAAQNESLELLNTMDEDPEQDNLVQVFQKYKENQRRLFDWASRYSNNPYISNLANAHMQHDSKMLDEWYTTEEKAHAVSRRGIIEGKEERLAEAKIGAEEALGTQRRAEAVQATTLTPLKSESERALAEQRRASAEASRAQAAKAAVESGQYTGYVSDVVDPTTLQEWSGDPEQGLVGLRQVVEANITRRQGPMGEALKEEFSDITRAMAKKYIDSQIKRKKAGDESAQREPGRDWDYSEDSIRSASALIDRDEARREHLRKRLFIEGERLGYNPQEVAERFPDLYETVISRPGVNPLTGTVDYGMVTAQLFGRTTKDLAATLGMPESEVVNFDKLIQKIKTSKDLGMGQLALVNSPIAQAFAMVQSSGGFDPRDPNRKFASYKELVQFLQSQGDQHIRVNIGGIESEDNALPSATRQAREKTRKLYDVMIEKFAPVIARELGLKGTPAAKKSDWSLLRQSGAGKLFGKAKQAAESIFSGE